MDMDELWVKAANYALDCTAEHFHERLIQDLLDEAEGDVSRALRLMTRVKPGGWLETTAQLLTGWGSYGGDYCIECLDSAARNPVKVWQIDTWREHAEPDLLISWREIFEYVKAGRKRPVQLALF